MKTRIRVRPGSQVVLLSVEMDRAMHQTGVSPEGFVTFGLPLLPKVRHWNAQDATTSGLLSFGTAKTFDGLSEDGFVGLTIGLPTAVLDDVSDGTGLRLQDAL